jgi:signal transduction histidine kinase
LFNAITNEFISAEARRELDGNIANIENMAQRPPPEPFHFRMQPPIEIMEGILIQIRQLGSIRQLMMNSDGIIINEYGEVVSPNLNQMNEDTAGEVQILANHYLNNKESFEDGAMVRFAGGRGTYYLLSIKFPVSDELSFSVLLYTDITSTLQFMQRINQTLGFLLVISALISVAISVFISSRVQQSIVRLCDYAEIIGRGNFNEKVESFDYKEFSKLAQSMNSMSDKLYISENNQKRFFQNVSHELRTPLMSIQGYAESILEDVFNKNEASEIILSKSERMAALVNQLLYISRLDSGLDEPDITTVSLNNIVYDCAERIKILAEKSGKEIIADLPESEIFIKADGEKMQSAVDNILSNGLRHAKTFVKISYTPVNDRIDILIEDDGAGINETDLPYIFERFYKGANGNSGLGLAICKDLIEKHGGSVKAENIYEGADGFVDPSDALPKGARFIVTMPMKG